MGGGSGRRQLVDLPPGYIPGAGFISMEFGGATIGDSEGSYDYGMGYTQPAPDQYQYDRYYIAPAPGQYQHDPSYGYGDSTSSAYAPGYTYGDYEDSSSGRAQPHHRTIHSLFLPGIHRGGDFSQAYLYHISWIHGTTIHVF